MRESVVGFEDFDIGAFVTGWPDALKTLAGRCAFSGNVEGQTGAEAGLSGGALRWQCDDIAGLYKEIGFTGVSAAGILALDGSAIVLAPMPVEVDYIDAGFPVEGARATIESARDGQGFSISGMSVSLFGGAVSAKPFTFLPKAESNTLTLELNEIQLPLIVDLAGLETIQITGAVSGMLPVTIREGTVVINEGRIQSTTGHGTIRYASEEAPALNDEQTSNIGLVMRALQNFEYDSLESGVNYSADGTLALKMKLTGVSPDYDPNQPIVLNLGIEDNIPQLLKSLRAVRSLEDIIERRVTN
jgi:hypothetical protein